jgi:hypothetical protein
VLSALLIPVSVVSVWAINTVTDTTHYVRTMAPLARNDIVINQLATRSTDTLFRSLNVEKRVEQLLPAQAAVIAPPIVMELRVEVHSIAESVLRSAQFGRLWDGLNRASHATAVSLLSGQKTKGVTTINKVGYLIINVTPVLTEVINSADHQGITFFDPVKTVLGRGNKLSVTLISSQQAAKATQLFSLVKALKWLVPLFTLLLAAAAVAIAVERRRTLLRLAMAAAFLTLVFVAALALGRDVFLDQATRHGLNRSVSGVVWDTVLRYLGEGLRWTLLILVVLATVLWLVGPSRVAVLVRGRLGAARHQLAEMVGELTAGERRVWATRGGRGRPGWLLELLHGARIAGVVVAGGVIVFGGHLSIGAIVTVAIALGVYLGLLQLVLAWARTAGPTPPTGPAAEPAARVQ